jgi:sugar lactone lactonase YvrE
MRSKYGNSSKVDSRRFCKFKESGGFVTKFRSSSVGLLFLYFSILTHAQVPLNQPNGLAFDAKGNLYVANNGTNQVLVYDTSLSQVSSISAGLNGPTRLAFDTRGDLYVTNFTGNNITRYDASLQQVTKGTISEEVFKPLGVAVDAYGDVYVANNGNNTISMYNVNGKLVGTLSQDANSRKFSAPGALAIHGRNIYVGTGPTSGPNYVTSYNVGELLTLHPIELDTYTDTVNTGPTGVAFDRSGNIYISDFYSGTATKYSEDGKLLLVINSQTSHCEGIALDKAGNIYVSNDYANTITIYDPHGNLINTLH